MRIINIMFFAAVIIAAISSTISFSDEPQLSDVQLANIEALSNDELPSIPCVKSVGSCVFWSTDANGLPVELTILGMVRASSGQ